MKVDPSILNRDQFIFRDCVIGGDESTLIFPSHIGVDWTVETLHFRSIILRKSDNRVLSCGHRKFLNHGEKPHLYPDPLQFKDWRISTKLDGSLIIVSRHKNELIVRTRGTSTIDVYETASEVHELLAEYPQLCGEGPDGAMVKDLLYSNSLLWEHCTPTNRIVIAYEKPSLTLLDVISHEDCSYWSAKQVDQLALVLGCARPDVHTFGSLDEIVKTLKTLKGIEGYVLAFNDNQNRVKCKAEDYLLKHRFKERATLPNTLDLWELKCNPDLLTFLASLERDFDAECMTMVKGYAEQICAARVTVETKLKAFDEWLTPLRLLSRKEAALTIIAQVEKPWQGACFTMLSGESSAHRHGRKLMELVLGI